MPAAFLFTLASAGCLAVPPPIAPTHAAVAPSPPLASDVVLAIDHSTLALLASGVDVDRDGVTGRSRSWATERAPVLFSPTSWTTDPDDTVHLLQLGVARAIVPRLAARGNRVGLVSFTRRDRRPDFILLSDDQNVVVPVGPAEPVLAALGDFPAAQERRRTDLDRLLEHAAKLLDAVAPKSTAPRPRAILLLSLGRPSDPSGTYWASERALERARELGERGIAVWAVPFGIASGGGFLHELTRATGGRVVLLEDLDAELSAPKPGAASAAPFP